MRTTLTVDDDIAHALEYLRAERKVSFKQIVNDVLRLGVAVSLQQRGEPAASHETRPVEGKPLLQNLDAVNEIIALAEGDEHR
jgi:hypothetical protein